MEIKKNNLFLNTFYNIYLYNLIYINKPYIKLYKLLLKLFYFHIFVSSIINPIVTEKDE